MTQEITPSRSFAGTAGVTAGELPNASNADATE
jgi:hypothetical protein